MLRKQNYDLLQQPLRSPMNVHTVLTGTLITVLALSGCATTEEQVIVGFTPLNVATANEQVTERLTPLQFAARDGELATVKKLLLQGVDVDATASVSGSTALILAATAGHESVVDFLLDAGAAVNTADKTDGTALMYASSKGYVGIVNKLLRHGATVNMVSPRGRLDSTALTLAAGNGQDAVLALLLKAGADADWRTARDGYTALMLAAELGHGSTVTLLLAAGANPDLKDRNGNTACELAAVNGQDAVTKALDDFYQAQGQEKRCRPGTKRM
jgi:ankyrin repeat protein